MRPWALCHNDRSTSSSSCSSGHDLTEGRTGRGKAGIFWKQFCSLARRRSGASRIHPALRRQTQLSRTRRSQAFSGRMKRARGRRGIRPNAFPSRPWRFSGGEFSPPIFPPTAARLSSITRACLRMFAASARISSLRACIASPHRRVVCVRTPY